MPAGRKDNPMQFTRKNSNERTSLKTLQDLRGKKKLQYIWDYYKLPLIVSGIILYVIIYMAYRNLTYKEPALYAALVNVDAGDTLTKQLSEGFLSAAGMDISESSLHLYSGLYLTDDENSAYYEYTYASQVKILATIDGELLDVVLMDQEAFDAFSQNGYLCNIDELLSERAPAFYQDVRSFIVENTYVAEDNSFELQFDSSLPYSAVTEEYPMGIALSQAGFIKQAGFEDTVYFGIVANSPRIDTALAYLQYLFYGE